MSIQLHLMHASLHLSQADRFTREDMAWVCQQGADAVSFTEIAGKHDILRQVGRAHNYIPVEWTNNRGEALLVNADRVRVKDKGCVQAHPAGADGMPARYISWGKLAVGDATVWYHTGHWLPNIDDHRKRAARHNMMSQQMAAQVRKHAIGGDLSFFSGDINLDDQGSDDARLNTIFRTNGLLTIWDEFKVYPNTRGRSTIDVIGSYTGDKRVTGKRYKVWPKQNSDHHFISAWYEITGAVATSVGGQDPGGNGGGGAGTPTGNGTSGTGPDPAQDDFYATGGSIDWSDYFDGAIYHLPQAVDDSDGPTHGDFISE